MSPEANAGRREPWWRSLRPGESRALGWWMLVTLLTLATVVAPLAEVAAAQEAPRTGEQETAEDPGDLPVVTLEPAFVVTAEGKRPFEGEAPLRPGQTVGLILSWPERRRPQQVRLRIPDAPPTPAALPSARPRRLVAKDPRAGGADVIEVLLLALGQVQLEPMVLTDPAGRAVARTQALTLTTEAVADAAAGQPAPARPPVPIAPDLPGLLLALAAIALAVGTAIWLIRRIRGRKGHRHAAPTPPPPPPEVRALDALEALLAEGLLERNLIKPFSIRLAEIGKGYLGEIAGVGLLEATTEECGRRLQRAGFDPEWIRWLQTWLGELDMIKFAGDRPAADHLREQAGALRAMIHSTSTPPEPVPQSPEPAPAAESAS